MNFQLRKDSLFAILLRSPWWISFAIALLLGAAGVALLPQRLRIAGALSGLPFALIGVLAVARQWKLPSRTRIAETRQALAAMTWPAFAELLEQAFRRDGYTVRRIEKTGVDFEIERKGLRTLVCARRWKSARIGLEALRPLQAARVAAEAADAIWVGLGAISDNARPFAADHRIAIWQAAELARALRGIRLPQSGAR